jgi:hypothetical protein
MHARKDLAGGVLSHLPARSTVAWYHQESVILQEGGVIFGLTYPGLVSFKWIRSLIVSGLKKPSD